MEDKRFLERASLCQYSKGGTVRSPTSLMNNADHYEVLMTEPVKFESCGFWVL